MSRRRAAVKKPRIPDFKYGSKLVTRFVNNLMLQGRKSTAQGVFYGALDRIQEKMPEVEPVEVFKQAVENVKPVLETKSRRVGGQNYQVPLEVRPERRTALSIRWLITNSRSRSERTMAERLSNELMDAYNNTGASIKKKDDTHRMAEANKVFAHYRW